LKTGWGADEEEIDIELDIEETKDLGNTEERAN
jgi:hypothetical protein